MRKFIPIAATDCAILGIGPLHPAVTPIFARSGKAPIHPDATLEPRKGPRGAPKA